MTIIETKLRVRYAETDQMRVAYHSNYMVWFEIGRVEFLRQFGFEYRQMEQHDDCHLPVVDLRCRYKSPAYYDDELVIRTRLKNVRGPLLHFAYDVVRICDAALLAEGESTHIVTDSKMQKKHLPQRYLQALEGVPERV